MEPNTSGTVSRRLPDLEDYIDMARRHKGWIIGPTLLGTVIAFVVAFLWPDTYLSVATIRVVPPQVPEKFVSSNVPGRMDQRISAMAQNILSRNTLQYIVTNYDLYKKERTRGSIDDIIENMKRRKILIGSVRSFSSGKQGMSAFQVGFRYENRHLANKVTADLVGRFIDANITERQSVSTQTTLFLREMHDQAKADLEAVEQKLAQYRAANKGRLPDQIGSTHQHLQTLQGRLTTLQNSISRVNQEKITLEAELRSTRENLKQTAAMPDPMVASAAAAARNEGLLRVDREIAQMERSLTQVLEHYTPSHPDVKRMELKLNGFRKERETILAKAEEVKPEEAPVVVPPQVVAANVQRVKELRALDGQVQRLQAQIQQRDMQLETYLKDVAEAEVRMKQVQSTIESGPVGDDTYQQLNRDLDFAQRRYQETNQKMSVSQIGTELETRRQSETLAILDPPTLPERPTAPDRPLYVGVGAAIGFGVGCFLAAAREVKDTALKNLKDVRAYTKLTLLGSIPLLENDLVVRRRRRMAWLGWSAASFLAAIVMAGTFYYHTSSKV